MSPLYGTSMEGGFLRNRHYWARRNRQNGTWVGGWDRGVG